MSATQRPPAYDPSTAAVLAFPLRGEWWAINSPADQVPSHGTDFLAQRYAIDFVRMNASSTLYYRDTVALLRHLSVGVAASEFFAWGQPVFAAAPGRVVAVGDGWPDRTRVNLFAELARATFVPPQVRSGGDLRPLAGNYVMIEGRDGVAFHAHLQLQSARVRLGQQVAVGEIIGLVGNSGNSTMPHLHFHLMDGPDPFTAQGLPFAFDSYERWVADGGDGRWERVERSVPKSLERVRTLT